MKLSLLILIIVGCAFGLRAEAIETVTVTMIAEGDMTGNYAFNGPLGKKLSAAATGSGAKCESSAVFRRATYRKKPSLEATLSFDCNFEGQKRHYKPHRIYLDLAESEHKVQLPVLAENLLNIRLIFREMSLKLSK